MRIALIADTFFPLRTSGAIQLYDLAKEFVRQGHDLTVIVAAPELDQAWRCETLDGISVLRLKTLKTHGAGHLRRAIGEFLMPFAMIWNLRRSPLAKQQWDGIVWYSPTIFLGPIVAYLKRKSHCRSYLIIRDIFPEWALDMGIIGPGLIYKFFKAVANYQYAVADVIGIQSPGNAVYFQNWKKQYPERSLEILHNWLTDRTQSTCSIQIGETKLRDRKIFVYAGNMGLAQGVDVLINLAKAMQYDTSIGFVFVGRGTETERMRSAMQHERLDNTLLFDEIKPDEIPALYAQCHAGMVALDHRHKTHNIPGKFISYMVAGLPVLANVNPGNDLVALIETEGVGRVSTTNQVDDIRVCAQDLISNPVYTSSSREKCRALAARLFSPTKAVQQLTTALGR
jgi:glycosyltransferase involved in cell wall biosynthesis